jgi:hypothetical protein
MQDSPAKAALTSEASTAKMTKVERDANRQDRGKGRMGECLLPDAYRELPVLRVSLSPPSHDDRDNGESHMERPARNSLCGGNRCLKSAETPVSATQA